MLAPIAKKGAEANNQKPFFAQALSEKGLELSTSVSRRFQQCQN